MLVIVSVLGWICLESSVKDPLKKESKCVIPISFRLS